eukprot:scaffold3198_cov163-Skeletonema_marinoi.AAC.4
MMINNNADKYPLESAVLTPSVPDRQPSTHSTQSHQIAHRFMWKMFFYLDLDLLLFPFSPALHMMRYKAMMCSSHSLELAQQPVSLSNE